MKEYKEMNRNMTQKPRRTSMVMGIIGICVAPLAAGIAMILGIVGLCIKKQEGKENRDIVLNTIAICFGLLCYVISVLIIATNPTLLKMIGG